MKRTLLAVPLSLLVVAPASAAGTADVKKACVAASTEGQTARDEGKLQKAKQRLLACSQDECPSVVRKSCLQWLADVTERAPSAIIRVLDSAGNDITDVDVSVDGESIALDGRPITFEPGQHVAELKTVAGKNSEHKFLLAEREQSRVITIRLAGPNPTPEAGRPAADASTKASSSGGFSPPTGAWALGGVAVLGLGSFTYFGLTAKKDLSDLQHSCSPNCSSDETKSGRHAATIADVSLVVAGAALIGALAWTLLSPSQPAKESASLTIVPMQNGAFAAFRGRY